MSLFSFLPWIKSEQVSFAFEPKQSKLFGQIYRPMATVKFWSETDGRWRELRMLIDTGADYTIIPRYAAIWLGLDELEAQGIFETEGVGGALTVNYLEKVKVCLGDFEREIPLGIAQSNQIPPLLGRQAFFETFQVQFKGKNKVIFQEK